MHSLDEAIEKIIRRRTPGFRPINTFEVIRVVLPDPFWNPNWWVPEGDGWERWFQLRQALEEALDEQP